MEYQLLQGDNRQVLRTLPDQSVHCIVTSPPYFGLRDYQTGRWDGGDPDCDHKKKQYDNVGKSTLDGGKLHNAAQLDAYTAYKDTCGKCGATRVDQQIGMEETPEKFVAELVNVFRECWRVLRDDGVLFLNLGDSYNGSGGAGGDYGPGGLKEGQPKYPGRKVSGLKPKDLIGIPWMVAFALRADGWYLRSDIIWHKPNPMPESVTDRPTKAHEYIFLLTKSQRYYYDADAVREPAEYGRREWSNTNGNLRRAHNLANIEIKKSLPSATVRGGDPASGRNRRSVWTVATAPYAGAHFATFPPALVEPCVLAGCPVGGTVLDPFNGSGTSGAVACAHGRNYIGIDLNADYIELAHERIREAINESGRDRIAPACKVTDYADTPLFAAVANG